MKQAEPQPEPPPKKQRKWRHWITFHFIPRCVTNLSPRITEVCAPICLSSLPTRGCSYHFFFSIFFPFPHPSPYVSLFCNIFVHVVCQIWKSDASKSSILWFLSDPQYNSASFISHPSPPPSFLSPLFSPSTTPPAPTFFLRIYQRESVLVAILLVCGYAILKPSGHAFCAFESPIWKSRERSYKAIWYQLRSIHYYLRWVCFHPQHGEKDWL